MNKKMLYFGVVSCLCIHASAFAYFEGKPLTDKEIRELIVKGSLSNFDRGMCYEKTAVTLDLPQQTPKEADSDTTTLRRSYNSGTFWPSYSIDLTNQTQQKESPPEPEPIYKCQCACPYSTNSAGQQCGENSAYFQYPIHLRPKCYIEDVKDWEVNDFRSLHEVPTPTK